MPRARARSTAFLLVSVTATLASACAGGSPDGTAATTAAATAGTSTAEAADASAAGTAGTGGSSDGLTGMSSGTGESTPTSGATATDATDDTSAASDPATSDPVTGAATSGPDASTGDPVGDPGPSCGQLAGMLGWGDDALCEQDGDGICQGTGEPTWDCERCCDASALNKGGFGYPVGDLSTFPAGGWSIGQVLSAYYADYGGRHLAHDINHPDGGVATIDAPVFAVADGLVRYAGPNSSLYKNVVLIEHAVEGEESVCSFYGHINAPVVSTGDAVTRGQQITTVMDWNLILGGSGNTHLHYVIVRKSLCDASAAASGALVCGYDEAGRSGVVDLDGEPFSYQPVGDLCGDSNYGDVFLSPTKFIEAHHF